MQKLTALLATFACCILAINQVQAQEKKADPTGTWTWSMQGRDGSGPGRVTTLKLKVDGEKLTGTMSSPGRQGGEGRQIEIQDGKVKGDEISFTVTREFGGNTMKTKYNGKVAGDAIKGKIETERDGQTRSREWEAKRVTEKK